MATKSGQSCYAGEKCEKPKSYLFSIFSFFDLFAKNIELTVEGKESYSNCCSYSCSILIYLGLLFYAFYL